MGLVLGCRVKQKISKCPYEEIKHYETIIEREKSRLYFMEEKIKKLEKMLKTGEPKIIYEWCLNYYDGFLWKEAPNLEEPLVIKQLKHVETGKHIKEHCPYVVDTCESILELKISRVRYLRKKMIQMTSYYNELINLLKMMRSYHERYAFEKKDLFVYFEASNKPCLVYFNLRIFQPIEEGYYLLSLFYRDEKAQEGIQHFIKCQYTVRDPLLQGTNLSDSYQEINLFRFTVSEQMNAMIEKQMIRGIHKLIKVLNHRYGKRYQKIQGCYIVLSDYALEKQMQLITDLTPLGYSALGYMTSQGHFEPNKILLHLYPTLN